ncbi:MAG TPA: UPF0280 family protein [Bacteroidota bacterium]|nr:UPF0280 family protein [Bacteroidota bacterium]
MIKRNRIHIKETIANLICNDAIQNKIIEEVKTCREKIENYIKYDTNFLSSLKPIEINSSMPEIVKEMCLASEKVGVGPMATIAGAISHYAVKKILDCNENFGIFDNGGDISIFTDREIIIGIYTGDAKIQNIGLKIKPNDKIMGICTSSGIIGHSLSFGRAHAVTVLSYDTLLADAVATALCNECKVKDQILIEESLKKFYIDGIIGAIVIFDDYLGFIGDIPELCETNIDFDLIAK